MIEKVAMAAAVALPFWNIPLIIKIMRRKSSRDISLPWALGVWVCMLLMAPAGFVSKDPVWRVYNIVNMILFTGVVIVVLVHRKPPHRD